MKIQRFNESVISKGWNPTDKVLRFTTEPIEVLINSIRETNKFQQFGRHNPNGPDDWKKDDLFYGIEEWIYTSGNPSFNYKLYDGLGNIIDNEPIFDEYIKHIKISNLKYSYEDYLTFENEKKYNL